MREAVELIVKALVREPGAVEVTATERDRSTTLIEVRVAAEDKGKIIGRQGSTARAIRLFLQAASAKHNRRFLLDILE